MKAISLLKYILLAVGAVSVLTLLFMPEGASVSLMLTWGYIVLAIACVTTIVLPLFNLVKNPQGAKRSLIGLAIIVVALAICYAFASAEPVVNSAGGYFENSAELKLSDTGLFATYAALAITVFVVVFGEIRNSFK